tara:strand:+ start:314 stop:508 length:195 start_codon:yes stop_codon:yes gene_type:complete
MSSTFDGSKSIKISSDLKNSKNVKYQGKYPEVKTLLSLQKIRPGFSLKSLKSKKIKKETKITDF